MGTAHYIDEPHLIASTPIKQLQAGKLQAFAQRADMDYCRGYKMMAESQLADTWHDAQQGVKLLYA